MHLKLSCYRLQIDCYNYVYESRMVTTKHKPIVIIIERHKDEGKGI